MQFKVLRVIISSVCSGLSERTPLEMNDYFALIPYGSTHLVFWYFTQEDP